MKFNCYRQTQPGLAPLHHVLALASIAIFASHCNSFAVLNVSYKRDRHARAREFISLGAHKRQGSVGRLKFCYQRLQAVQPEEMEYLPVDQVAEALEDILKTSMEEGNIIPEKSYIACLDGWMVAFNKSQRNVLYGERMVQILDIMETTNCKIEATKDEQEKGAIVSTVDPYATVIHAWLSCQEATRALQLLARMENNPLVRDEDNAKVVQYNKILKGLVNSDNITIAIELLNCMCRGSLMEWEGVTFITSVKPNANSFVSVLGALSIEDDADPDGNVLRFFLREARILGVLEGFLLRKLRRLWGNDTQIENLLADL